MPDRPKSRATLSAAWARGLVEAFEARGLDIASLSQKLGVPPHIWRDPAARLPRDLLGRLWREALRATEDRFLALTVGELWEPRADNLVFLLMTTAPRLGEGLESACQYQELLSHARVMTLAHQDDKHFIEINRVEDELPILMHEIEFIAVALMKLCAFVTGGAFRLRELQFEHAYRGGIDRYETLFQAPVVFGARKSALVVDDEVWSLPLRHGNQALHAQLGATAAAEHAQIGTRTFVDEVRDKCRGLLPKGQCSIEGLASAMHLAPRTLQRRLQDRGTSFREVVDAARRSIVRDGLERRQSISEMGSRAGFTNLRSLRRAMKRWNLSSPPDRVGS